MEDNKRRECVGEGEGERIIQTPKGGILACSILTCSTENMEGEGLGDWLSVVMSVDTEIRESSFTMSV